MGFFDGFKVRAAMLKQQKEDYEGAKVAYEALYQEGKIDASYLLPYTVLLLRDGGEQNYLKVKEILKKLDKLPNLSADKKQQIHLNYACAQFKLGHLDEAIHLLEATHQKNPCGNTYGALGYLYVEKGDTEKGLPFLQSALDYDDEDAICLDNMGQYYYRVENNKEQAYEYFKKAHDIKPKQIDTLYFLSLYDIEKGDKESAQEKLQTALEGRFSPLNYATKNTIEQTLQTL